MNCGEEMTHTQNLLGILYRRRYFKFHTVIAQDYLIRNEPAYRDLHLSAVITDMQTGKRWAIDSWVNPGGKEPLIQKASEWYVSCSTE